MDNHTINSIISLYTTGSGIELTDTRISSAHPFETHYAPFDYINTRAKIAICGLTPGKSQSKIALDSLKTSLSGNVEMDIALKTAKETASFAGAMRSNLTLILDYLKLNNLLDIKSCGDLFGSEKELVHYTSALRYPVLKNGKDYSGDSAIVNNSYLYGMVEKYLLEEIRAIPNCIWVPLGKGAQMTFQKLIDAGHIKPNFVLMGFPHPSGANAERIKYFIGQKEKHLLSQKVDPAKMDTARAELTRKIELLLG
jgi:hypothetical protein